MLDALAVIILDSISILGPLSAHVVPRGHSASADVNDKSFREGAGLSCDEHEMKYDTLVDW